MSPRPRSIFVAAVLLAASASVGCNPAADDEIISVVLNGAEIYELDIPVGDEDGARIVEQARHFAVSEIRRDASTLWSARYVYEPAADFVGQDRVELEVLTGSDGASAPTRRQRIIVRFTVRD